MSVHSVVHGLIAADVFFCRPKPGNGLAFFNFQFHRPKVNGFLVKFLK